MARAGALWIIGCVAMLAGWPGQSGAGALPPNPSDRAALARFKQLDHHATLRLTLDELTSTGAARRVFAILDRNDDGRLTAADGAPARRLLRRTGLGAMSRGQFATLGARRWMAVLDADGDNGLSMAELRPAMAGTAPLEAAPPPRPDLAEAPARPQPCWYFDGTGRWVELPASDPTCRMR